MSTTFRGKLTKDASLTKLNTWHVGGHAKQLYKPADLDDLSVFLSSLDKHDSPLWLGLGSNVLIRDGGISSTVIVTKGGINKLELVKSDCFRAEAGVTCAKAAKFCVKHDFIDAEFFAGIPGTIGGALVMNAGAFGAETWDYVVDVETIDEHGVIHKRCADEYEISYRSVKGPGITKGEKEWFVAAYFKLPQGDGKETKQNIRSLLTKRGESQPIGLPSCGSVFTNPPNDHAARLIEACGLKSYTIGGAQVSPKHANFIINTGNATAKDIEDLIMYIQSTIEKEQGIRLIPEVKIFGLRE